MSRSSACASAVSIANCVLALVLTAGCSKGAASPLAGASLVMSGARVTALELSLRAPASVVAILVSSDGTVRPLLPGGGATAERLPAGNGQRIALEIPIDIASEPDRAARVVVGLFEVPPQVESLLEAARAAAGLAGADPKERSYACLRALDEAGGSGVVLPLAAE